MHTRLNLHSYYGRNAQCASGHLEKGMVLSGYAQLGVRLLVDLVLTRAKFLHNRSVVDKL